MRVRRCDAGRGLQGGRPLYAGAHAQAGAPGAPVRDKTESASFGCVYPDAGCKADLQFCPPFAGRGPCVRSGRRRLLYRDTVLSVVAEALFSRAGTFYSGLLEEGLIRPGFSYGSTVLRDLSYLAVSGESDCVLEVYQRFCAYLENVRKNGISKEDFERARRVMYADFVTAFDSTEDVASMLFSAAVDGIGLFESLDMIERVTVSDANALLDRECLQENMQLTVVEPLADGESEEIENGDTD